MTNVRNEIRRPAFYHDIINYEHKMLHSSMNSRTETIMTFSILVVALASLFASDPIVGNQQALAAGGGGGAGGGVIVLDITETVLEPSLPTYTLPVLGDST